MDQEAFKLPRNTLDEFSASCRQVRANMIREASIIKPGVLVEAGQPKELTSRHSWLASLVILP